MAASVRSQPAFCRPINLLRAMSRSESPARMRTSTCRYWYIWILLRLISTLRAKCPNDSEEPENPRCPPFRTPEWPDYAENQLA